MPKDMTRNEAVVLHMRTHAKALFWPVVALLVLTALLGVALAVVPNDWGPGGTGALLGTYALALGWLVGWPFAKWYTSTFTVTTRRITTRRGVFNKQGHDLPLRRVNNVNTERSLTDRMLGCGTLVLETAAGQPLVLHDVPRAAEVHAAINTLLFEDTGEDEDLDD